MRLGTRNTNRRNLGLNRMMPFCKLLGDSYRQITKGAELADPHGKDKKEKLPNSTKPGGKATTSTALVAEAMSSPFSKFGYTKLERDRNQQRTVLEGLGNALVATMPVMNPSGEVANVAPPGTQIGHTVHPGARRTPYVRSTGHSRVSSHSFQVALTYVVNAELGDPVGPSHRLGDWVFRVPQPSNALQTAGAHGEPPQFRRVAPSGPIPGAGTRMGGRLLGGDP